MKKLTVEDILNENSGMLLFHCVSGSHAYNTDIESSDEDVRFVYIQPIDDIMGLNYTPQVAADGNDIVGYEIRRFLELLAEGKVNALELLAIPAHCIIYKHPLYDSIIDSGDRFITKNLSKSMAGFANAQIKKASGQDKKMNWARDRVTRKTVLDFCTIVLPNGGSIGIHDWLSKHGNNYKVPMHQQFCGLSKIPKQRDSYALFYDWSAHIQAGFAALNPDHWEVFNDEPSLGYQGIVHNTDTSNNVCISAIPKGRTYKAILSFNKDAYSEHCKDYRDYQDYIINRNPQRMVETITHGQRYDGKNMLHCVRYLMMAKEIAQGKGLNLYRNQEDRDILLNIRSGGIDLFRLIEESKSKINELDKLFADSSLPNSVSIGFVNALLIIIRREFYNKPL